MVYNNIPFIPLSVVLKVWQPNREVLGTYSSFLRLMAAGTRQNVNNRKRSNSSRNSNVIGLRPDYFDVFLAGSYKLVAEQNGYKCTYNGIGESYVSGSAPRQNALSSLLIVRANLLK